MSQPTYYFQSANAGWQGPISQATLQSLVRTRCLWPGDWIKEVGNPQPQRALHLPGLFAHDVSEIADPILDGEPITPGILSLCTQLAWTSFFATAFFIVACIPAFFLFIKSLETLAFFYTVLLFFFVAPLAGNRQWAYACELQNFQYDQTLDGLANIYHREVLVWYCNALLFLFASLIASCL